MPAINLVPRSLRAGCMSIDAHRHSFAHAAKEVPFMQSTLLEGGRLCYSTSRAGVARTAVQSFSCRGLQQVCMSLCGNGGKTPLARSATLTGTRETVLSNKGIQYFISEKSAKSHRVSKK